MAIVSSPRSFAHARNMWLASVLFVALSLLVAQSSAFGKLPTTSFATRSGRQHSVTTTTRELTTRRSIVLWSRGGATKAFDEDEEDEDVEEEEEGNHEDGHVKVKNAAYEDDEEEDEIVVESSKAAVEKQPKVAADAKMALSALKATQKSKAKLNTSIKKVVSAELKTTAPKTKSSSTNSGGVLKLLHIPYIVRAIINPITLFRMTRAYFASLFDLNYVQNVRKCSSGLSPQHGDVMALS